MSGKEKGTQDLPSRPDPIGAKINVFPPQDRSAIGWSTDVDVCMYMAPESPYMDPATGKLIPIEDRDWRRTVAYQGQSSEKSGGDTSYTAPDGRDSLDPNELDFSIERKESRLPPED